MNEKLIPEMKSVITASSTSEVKLTPVTPILQSLNLSLEERWYVVQALARREPIAKMRLEAQGYRIFLPQMIKTVRHARKMRQARVAVFPGYLFVAFNPLKDRWRSINGTIGVARIITANEVPAPVPRGIVETLVSHMDNFGICRFDHDLKRVRKYVLFLDPLLI